MRALVAEIINAKPMTFGGLGLCSLATARPGASGLGLPGDGIAESRDGVEWITRRELQRHGPMSRARGTVYVLGFNAQYAKKTCRLAL